MDNKSLDRTLCEHLQKTSKITSALSTHTTQHTHTHTHTHTERVLLGDNEGLYMLNVVDEGLFKFTDRDIKKVTQIRILQEEGLIALLAGSKKDSKWMLLELILSL